MQITEFNVSVEHSTIEQLRDRLINTRYPDQIAGSGWHYGTNLSYLKELMLYWQTDFNWPNNRP